MAPTKPPQLITTPSPDDSYSLHRRVMLLPICVAVVSQTGEYHYYKNIRRYVTMAPLGVEVFSRRCGHCFIHCLSCSNQYLDALPNLHEHVPILFELSTSSY